MIWILIQLFHGETPCFCRTCRIAGIAIDFLAFLVLTVAFQLLFGGNHGI